MDYTELVGRVWKTQTTMSNGNIDYGEIKLSDISRFVRAERKRSKKKGLTLTPVARWVMSIAVRNFEEYVKGLDGDIKLKSIAIQCVKE